MPRQRAVDIENNFVGGLVTEATALSFPENACTETFDCEFDVTGRITRRKGMDYESGNSSEELTPTSTQKYTEFVWTAVAGNGGTSLLVQQYGRFLRFYDISDNTTPSANDTTFDIDLNSFIPAGSSLVPHDFHCQFAQGGGKLIVVNPAIDPIYVEYTGAATVPTELNLKYRDFDGAPDTNTVYFRVTSTWANLLTTQPNHAYNIVNQGWFINAINQWDAARTDLPALSDQVAFYRASETDEFDTAQVDASQVFKATAAPKGHFILDVANPNRTTAMADQSFTATVTGDSRTFLRPSTVAFFAGRAWYAGINAADWSSGIYFSQIVENDFAILARCYQNNDPTSEFSTDLLPSDGGLVKILEVGNVKKLFAMQQGLVVFADNGIWMIAGISGSGFAANEYIVRKLSSTGILSPMSVVDVKGTPIWWGEDGIYTLSASELQQDAYDQAPLTVKKLDTFYRSIPQANKQHVKGAYDPLNFVVCWIYNNTENLASDNFNVYNHTLKFNVVTKAFWPQTIDTTAGPKVRGISFVQAADHSGTPAFKFTTTVTASGSTDNLTYSEQKDTTYYDWSQVAPTNYTSYFITGYKLHGQTQRKFQPNYVFTFMEVEEDASLKVQGIFDFTTSGNSGRWSTLQQVYNSNAVNASVSVTRRVIRGQGRSCQLRFQSQEGKPFTIIGWSTNESANAEV